MDTDTHLTELFADRAIDFIKLELLGREARRRRAPVTTAPFGAHHGRPRHHPRYSP